MQGLNNENLIIKNKTMKKIIILCFETGEVLVYPYDENVWENGEDFMSSEEIGINHNNCQWMIVNELEIKIM